MGTNNQTTSGNKFILVVGLDGGNNHKHYLEDGNFLALPLPQSVGNRQWAAIHLPTIQHQVLSMGLYSLDHRRLPFTSKPCASAEPGDQEVAAFSL